ncbi:DUF4261 domain-containing protein [Corynebacterium guangdongense]|uniref:DUF4261 domain-containing protein n=1 Tax=Corynebacterium guangdongense TaxID=1783348 RepID=A0ABU1ZV05_9CORY|nr:DUF4261 domain-containing protein [Corynebacterium guangdongense]MDR7328766.1 hypothetical protein [Corynebacterium guangdongense]WJZ17342.1 hypothetical protein CGUA_03735 [Corynebacterium guangdongense]
MTQTPPANDVAMGTILLSSHRDAESLLELVRRFAPGACVGAEGETGSAIIQYSDGGVELFLTPIDASHAGQEVVDYIHPILTEEEEIPHIINHSAQLLVVAARLGGGNPGRAREERREVRQAHARAIRGLIDMEEAVGYVRPGTTMGLRALRGQLADATQPPVYLHAPVWLWAGDDGLTAYTFGLADLGHPELQVVASAAEPAEIFTLLCDLVAYVAEKGATLSDGDTFGRTGGERIPLTGARWLVDAEQDALRLEI